MATSKPTTAMQEAMLRAAVRASMEKRVQRALKPETVIAQSTKANDTVIPPRRTFHMKPQATVPGPLNPPGRDAT